MERYIYLIRSLLIRTADRCERKERDETNVVTMAGECSEQPWLAKRGVPLVRTLANWEEVLEAEAEFPEGVRLVCLATADWCRWCSGYFDINCVMPSKPPPFQALLDFIEASEEDLAFRVVIVDCSDDSQGLQTAMMGAMAAENLYFPSCHLRMEKGDEKLTEFPDFRHSAAYFFDWLQASVDDRPSKDDYVQEPAANCAIQTSVPGLPVTCSDELVFKAAGGGGGGTEPPEPPEPPPPSGRLGALLVGVAALALVGLLAARLDWPW